MGGGGASGWTKPFDRLRANGWGRPFDKLGANGAGGPLGAGEAALEDLLHHREVVGALHALDAEAAVLGGPRVAFDEHDHRADRRRALDVRDVVALDAR